jgi:hypothetical protein
MAKFCSKDCKAICDFCIHYRDKYEEIDILFSGNGICDIDNTETYADSGLNCDNFECFCTLK